MLLPEVNSLNLKMRGSLFSIAKMEQIFSISFAALIFWFFFIKKKEPRGAIK
jgi:hypothetical protein